jgi:AraC family transcriptional regulator
MVEMTSTGAEHRKRILAALLFIQAHLDEDPDLEAIARVAHFSPFHFHRVFRGLVGEGVAEHVRRLRLERAAYQLKFSEAKVVRIALDAGFEAHESFTRAFTAHFGMPPSAFRKLHRSVPVPAAPSRVHFVPGGETPEFTPLTENRAMNVQVEKLPARRVAFVRHTGPYQGCGAAWQRLFQWAGMKGLLTGPVESFGLCYDDPEVTSADKIRYDACLVPSRPVQPEGDIGVQDVAGGEFATLEHVGPYGTLSATYDYLCGPWAAGSGRALGTPPSMEFYLNDPGTTPEQELRTKVCIRLA